MNYDELERLVGLRNSGALTEAEFNEQKAILIGSSQKSGKPFADPETALFSEHGQDNQQILTGAQNTNDGSSMRLSGVLLMVFGTLIAWVAFSMRTTAILSETLNIGLLNDQNNLVIAGTQIAVCGTILFSVGCVIRELNASRASGSKS